MPPGKLASQAGHAFLEAYRLADAQRQARYHQDGLGTKVCLTVTSLQQLYAWYERLLSRNLPCALITDTGRNTTFGGVPTVSALGVGPLDPEEAAVLRRLPLCV
jgi:peptidyl-tRNA hydrolase